jgi:hypothetical protein
MYALEQSHFACNTLLSVSDGAFESPPAHGETQRHVSREVLAVDERGALGRSYIRDERKRMLAPAGVETRIRRIASRLWRYWGSHLTTRSKRRSPSRTWVTAWPPIADIGEKIAPSTPRIVKSGRKAIMKISVEKRIGLPTSSDARRMFPWRSLTGAVQKQLGRIPPCTPPIVAAQTITSLIVAAQTIKSL